MKAQILCTFAEFVEWPANTFTSTNGPIRIGILGKDPFGDFLRKIARLYQPDGHGFRIERSQIKQRYTEFVRCNFRHPLAVNIFSLDKLGVMKIIGGIGLLFFLYCLLQVVSKWRHRDAIERAIWLLVIAGGSWWCISAFR